MPDLLTPASEMPADEMAIAEARTRSRGELLDKLAQAINFTNTENASNTPDFILANFAAACLDAFAEASVAREAWYGKSLSIGGEASDIAAMEARTPAPALPADMEALLAEEVQKVAHARKKLRALCNGRESFTMRIPADRTYDHDLAFADAFDVCDNLATALRETLAREQAEHARAEKAEAERDAKDSTINMMTGQLNAARRFASDYGTERDQARADLAAARKELAGLGPVEYQVISEKAMCSPVVSLRDLDEMKYYEDRDYKTQIIRRVLEGGAQ